MWILYKSRVLKEKNTQIYWKEENKVYKQTNKTKSQ
jgi:hypothetical protein